ncbi:MAG: TetR/AcrR family transcriptional regulator [Bacteroidota bacterium]
MKTIDRKTEIVTISAKLFRQKGFSAVSMRDIALALDIKAASLYNHIKSKQEILVLIIIDIAKEFTQSINAIAKSKNTSLTKLEKLIEQHIDITLRNADAMACLNNDWMHLPDDELKAYIKMRNEYEEKFRKIVKAGIASGEIKNLNVEVIIFSLLSTLRTLYLWYGKKSALNIELLKADMTKALLKGIV